MPMMDLTRAKEISAQMREVPPALPASPLPMGGKASKRRQLPEEPEDEKSILWNDSDLAISWPVDRPYLSFRDKNGTRFRDLFV